MLKVRYISAEVVQGSIASQRAAYLKYMLDLNGFSIFHEPKISSRSGHKATAVLCAGPRFKRTRMVTPPGDPTPTALLSAEWRRSSAAHNAAAAAAVPPQRLIEVIALGRIGTRYSS